jgi:putative ABC transport system permease protein
MIKATLRGMFGRKLRTILTAVSILLGVAMVAGTFVMTDTIRTAFDTIFKTADKNVSAVIKGKTAVTSNTGTTPPIPAAVLEAARKVDGVRLAEGGIQDTAKILNDRGKEIGGNGPPQLAFSVSRGSPFNPLVLVAGRWPTGGSEVAIDKKTADDEHWAVGRRVEIATKQPKRAFRIVGIAKFGDVDSLGGATMALFDDHTAQQLFNKKGKWDQISLAADAGVSQAELVKRLRAAHLPASVPLEIKTGTQDTKDNASDVSSALSFITYALLAFGGIALFVGAFIIFNTFSITVAQRARELGLMRALGATRRQVLTAVLAEAFVIGVGASLIGLAGGILVGKGMLALFKAFGADLPHTGTAIETRTIVLALVVGIVVTLAAGLMPALRATRVAPVEALREGASLPPGRLHRWVPWIAAAIGALAVLMLAIGLLGDPGSTSSRLALVGFGCFLLFIGVAMLSSKVVKPIVRVVGWPARAWFGMPGRLANENTVRNPGRTATTAAALMIGLALIAFVTIFAEGLKETANAAIRSTITADELISNTSFNGTFTPLVRETVAKVPGVQVTSPLATDNTRIVGKGTHTAWGVDPATIGKGYVFHWVQGDYSLLGQLGANGALVEKTTAHDAHLKVGQTFTMITPKGTRTGLVVRGIYKDQGFLGGYLLPLSTWRAAAGTNEDNFLLVSGSGSPDVLKLRIKAALRDFSGIKVQTKQDIEAENQSNVNGLLILLYVLLAFSVLISIFGIVNTLVLSIFERTREIGLLRAIGTSRWQIRKMITYESVLTSLIGAVLGLVVGIFLAWIMTLALSDLGLQFALPYGQLVVFFVVAAVFGVIAAIFPARRAARLNVLEALAYE